MKIKLENFGGNIMSFMRSCGYAFIDRSPDDEWNFARRTAGGDYPRFHCYLKKEQGVLIINLHLDQKRPSYQGSRGHVTRSWQKYRRSLHPELRILATQYHCSSEGLSPAYKPACLHAALPGPR